MDVQFVPKLLMSRTRWVSPVSDGSECLTAVTPLGLLSLRRHRSDVPSVGSAVGGVLEDWKISLDGQALAEIRGVAPPGHPMRMQVRGGVTGHITGDAVDISALRTLRRQHRYVAFASAERTVEFRGRPQRVRVHERGGTVLAEKNGVVWKLPADDLRTFAATSLFELAGLDSFLVNPVLAVL
ncbi:hypothetical protein AB0D46_27920 [Streptomyces sp. NPDC048383]|uniref:hypothetical protein n=1 Tax=Streptomyces sp. NPDC048383 TaxID=3155386 RepID=UPI00342E415B